jgi:hypothetical protein
MKLKSTRKIIPEADYYQFAQIVPPLDLYCPLSETWIQNLMENSLKMSDVMEWRDGVGKPVRTANCVVPEKVIRLVPSSRIQSSRERHFMIISKLHYFLS